jgi:hypothetical protein
MMTPSRSAAPLSRRMPWRTLLLVVALAAPAALDAAPGRDYLGQPTPGEAPVLFAPGMVSTDIGERDLAVSPDGDEIVWTLQGGGSFGNWFATLIATRREAGRWGTPRVLPFSGRCRDLEPCFSPDGRRLYFVSDRATAGDSAKRDFDVWFVERTPAGWGPPRSAGPEINTAGNEFYPSVSRDGALFFTSERAGGRGAEDIWRAPAKGAGFGPAAPLDSVDTAAGEYNACVSGDGGTLLYGRDGDLYASFRRADGAWTAGRMLGPPLDSPNLDYCPSLSPDGRFLFWTSTRPPDLELPPLPPGFDALLAQVADPARRKLLRTRLQPYSDVYWISAGFLDRMRDQALGTR